MAPGYKTTEFWVALMGIAGIIWTFVQANCNIDPTKLLALSGVIVTYILGRSWVKATAQSVPTSTSTPSNTGMRGQ